MLSAALLIMIAVCATACSGDSVVEPTPQEPQQTQRVITFTGSQAEGEGITRATSLSVFSSTFKVWAYKNDAYESGSYTSYQTVIPSYNVNYNTGSAYTTTSNTNDWEYVGMEGTGDPEQTIKYWDFDAKAYRFFGYTLGKSTADPATPAATVSIPGGYPTGASSSATSVTLSATIDASSQATMDAAPYFSHLWFSDGNPANYPGRLFGQPVQLQFLKPFARVRFLFTFVEGLNFGREKLWTIKFWPTVNTDNDDTNDQIIATAGTVNVSYPLKGTDTTESWTTSGTTGIQAFTIDYYAQTTTPNPSNPETYPNSPEKWYYVLPASNQGSYTLEVAVVTNEIKKIVIPAEYMTWNAGYEYTYKFKVTEGGGITLDIIQVGIDDWVIRNTSEHTVYNW